MTDAPTNRIPFHRPSITNAERDAVLAVLDSGWLTTGERALEFERAIARTVGVRHAVAVSSATAALHLALEAIGVGPADEVVVPTYTFAACGEVVRYLGARPRLADVDPTTLNVTASTVEASLTPATRAIIVVHFAGLMVHMEPILEIARARGIAVVEDAAHAFPASVDGRSAGSVGTAGALSFYATKTITTGEGGMLLTDDREIADRARVMRLHGISRDAWKRYSASGSWFYEIEDAGYKYNLTDLAAALGLAQLERAEAMRRERERVARRYRDAVTVAGVDEFVELPPEPGAGVVHAWHLYPVRLRLDRLTVDRGEVIARLGAAGIGTSVHFIPLHLHPYYRRTYGYRPTDLPVAVAEYERELSLPIYPGLEDAQVDQVVDALAKVLRPAASTARSR